MRVVDMYFANLVWMQLKGLLLLVMHVQYVVVKNFLPFLTNKLTEKSEASMCSVLTKVKDVSGKVN